MDNPEKLVTQGTKDEDKQNKNTTQYVLNTTIPKTNTNNVNKTRALLQATVGKDDVPNIKDCRSLEFDNKIYLCG